MMGNETPGLVGRVTEMLAEMPDPVIGLPHDPTPAATERRARLALRIALLRRGDIVFPVKIDMTPLRQPDLPEPQDLIEPPAELSPSPAPPRQKPARVSMSTLGLEQAAMLLAAAAAPDEQQTPYPSGPAASAVLSEPEASEIAESEPATADLAADQPNAPKMKKSSRASGGVKDMGDAFAALAAFGEADSDASTEAVFAAELASEAEDQLAKTSAPSVKTRRRSGAISAADGLANAAAALAAMQADDPEEAPAVKPSSASNAAMAAGFAAFDEAED